MHRYTAPTTPLRDNLAVQEGQQYQEYVQLRATKLLEQESDLDSDIEDIPKPNRSIFLTNRKYTMSGVNSPKYSAPTLRGGTPIISRPSRANQIAYIHPPSLNRSKSARKGRKHSVSQSKSPEVKNMKNKVKIRMMQREVSGLMSEVGKRQKVIADMSTKVVQKKNALKRTKKQAKLDERLNYEEKSLMEEHIKQMEDEKSVLFDDIKEQKELARESLVSMRALTDQYEKEKQDISKENKSFYEAKIDRMKNKYGNKNSDLAKTNKELESTLIHIEDDYKYLKEQLHESEKNCELMERQNDRIDQYKGELIEYKRREDKTKEELMELRMEMAQEERLNGEKRKFGEQRMTELEVENVRLTKEIDKVYIEVGLKKDEIQMIRNEVLINENNYNAKLEFLTEREESLREQVKLFEDKLHSGKRDKKELYRRDMEIQQLREQLENQNDQLNLLKRKCKEKLFKAEKNRKLQKDEWNNVYQDLLSEMSNLKQEIGFLEEENRMFRNRQQQYIDRSPYEDIRFRSPPRNPDYYEDEEPIQNDHGLLKEILRDMKHNKKQEISVHELSNLVDLKMLENRAKRTLKA